MTKNGGTESKAALHPSRVGRTYMRKGSQGLRLALTKDNL
ncbi:rCG36171 [Rattus norvegicus]|uniref:RCG36171 n=1 Tax=Rattus norvegicus TaxID=10116 RepID=A6IJG6_RAT|nr:rCG36171 [Rattus norvegicus]